MTKPLFLTLTLRLSMGLLASGLLSIGLLSIGLLPATATAIPQVADEAPARTLRLDPVEITLGVGESVQLTAQAIGLDGEPEEAELGFFSRSRKSVSVGRTDGLLTAMKPGSFEVIVRERLKESAATQEGETEPKVRLSGVIKVTVLARPLEKLELVAPSHGFYAGTVAAFSATGTDISGAVRDDLKLEWTSSDPSVASIDAFGELVLHRAGAASVTVAAEEMTQSMELSVVENPVARLELAGDLDAPRTGDVIHWEVAAFDAGGAALDDVPVEVTFMARTEDTLGAASSGQIERIPGANRGWRFVADQPGRYTFYATSGNAVARSQITVEARNVTGSFKMVGHAPVRDTHTSDLWVWEGVDGRDYAVTGTWGANGDAHFWDVTDPASMERIATVNIDARTVNDVKVSADGRTCILSREGASNRKNGIVVVDVTDPRNPEIKSGFDDELTGGVHNVFIDGNKVYALSAGARYDAIDIADRGAPKRVGSYKVNAPSPSIHDVWVEDGLAYSSNWSDGVHIVDVGNGMAGGSPSNPVKVADYAYPSGWNHAAFPFRQPSGRFYVAAGDEAFPLGLNLTGKPTYPRGWIHFIDFTDLDNPSETARYQVPEAGTHNMWIDGDVMYVAYYNAGLRAVDVSGELMGNLYDQGREIAWFLTDDPEGYVKNAPMVWGPQPHKGHLFFSDWNSGLWAVKLER